MNAAFATMLAVLAVILVIVFLFVLYHMVSSYRIKRQAVVLHYTVIQLQGPQVVLVQFAGDVVPSKTYRFPDEQAFCQATERAWKNVLVNLSQVNYLPQKTIGRLIHLNKELQLAGGRLVLSNLDPMIADAFRITKLDQMFSIAPDEKEGIRMLASVENSPDDDCIK